MNLYIQHFVIFITIGSVLSCQRLSPKLSEIAGKQLPIASSLLIDDSVDAFIAPYRNRLNTVLDSTLAVAAGPITKTDGDYNSSLGNLMADIVFAEASPIFKQRTGHTIDFVLLNFGGIRAPIAPGKVSARTAYEVMPFENSIVVVKLNGKSVQKLVDYLIASKKAHPISGIQVVLDANNHPVKISIQDKPFDERNDYFVATSDYLLGGGDRMFFFEEATEHTDINYYVRNAMIDYFNKVDSLSPVVDDRFYKTN
jgi:2',3'-cyclic-nucleotide 2'-phosphodiesterase (5'-nucleotidase family)